MSLPLLPSVLMRVVLFEAGAEEKEPTTRDSGGFFDFLGRPLPRFFVKVSLLLSEESAGTALGMGLVPGESRRWPTRSGGAGGVVRETTNLAMESHGVTHVPDARGPLSPGCNLALTAAKCC